MSEHPAFRRAMTDALVERFTATDAVPTTPSPSAPVVWRRPGRALSTLRALVREPVARYLDRRLTEKWDAIEAQLRSMSLDEAATQLQRLDALEVNGEMLKSEIRAVNHKLQRLADSVDGMAAAIAPTAGIDGVPERFAELRERLNAVERRTRNAAVPSPARAPGDVPRTPETESFKRPTSPIDYVGFERRFRGESAEVQQVTRERYLELLRHHGPVLDVGCGKAELVEALAEAGVPAIGIDLDPAMVDEGRARGLDVRVADLNTFLEGERPCSFGAVISTQVVEHLQIDQLVRFLELSATRLRPGGVFIAETPNPTSLIVLGTHFILDPTHVRPIHPALMVYLCECAGFRSVELNYYEPARDHFLSMLSEADGLAATQQINAAFTKLNDVLFGPQDYAVIARTPP